MVQEYPKWAHKDPKHASLSYVGDMYEWGFLTFSFINKLRKKGSSHYTQDYTIPGSTLPLIIKELDRSGLALVSAFGHTVDNEGVNTPSYTIYASDTCLVSLRVSHINDTINITFVLDPRASKKSSAIFDDMGKINIYLKEFKPAKKAPGISIIKHSVHGLISHSCQLSGREFVPEFYGKSTVEALINMKNQIIATDKVFGRLHILAGPPGTGKTSIIYSLLTEDPVFFLIPGTYVSQLQGPELVSFLLDNKINNKPSVLIIEDADSSLENRATGSGSNVSSLLNAVDGLLSEHLDLRVIATTNLDTLSIDKALLRPGRLGSLVTLPELTYEESMIALDKISPENEITLDKGSYTLAELFHMVNFPQAIVKPVKKRSIGF